eukprot:243607_1
MLRRASKRLAQSHYHQYRNFAANPAAFDAWDSRIDKLKSQYPNLFNSSTFLSEQEQLLSSYKSSLPSLITEYNSAKQQIYSATGDSVFFELNEDDLLSDLENKNK